MRGGVRCDADVARNKLPGTIIGMGNIKARRLSTPLGSYPDLHVGDCVPFYFCPRSVMLYMIYKANAPDLPYRGGQSPIVHLCARLNEAIAWAGKHEKRWAFTTSNAGSSYFEDYNSLENLQKINWAAVQEQHWSGSGVSPAAKEEKQAEFLFESAFPWELIRYIGVYSESIYRKMEKLLAKSVHRPDLNIRREWYYG